MPLDGHTLALMANSFLPIYEKGKPMLAVLKDIFSGALPTWEIPAFVCWLISDVRKSD